VTIDELHKAIKFYLRSRRDVAELSSCRNYCLPEGLILRRDVK
jgi:hypothetical protein